MSTINNNVPEVVAIVDLEKYLEYLKAKGVDVTKVEEYLEEIIFLESPQQPE